MAPEGVPVPVELAQNLVSTRPNILDGRAIGAYRPGQQVYVIEPLYLDQDVGTSTERISRKLAEIRGGEPRPNEFHEVPVDTLIDLLDEVRVADGSGDWNHEAIVTVLRSIARIYAGRGFVYFREFRSDRAEPVLSTGSIGGSEQQQARQQRGPVLFLLRATADTAARWGGVVFYHATVVFPNSMPVQVFNAT
jgi:hypothetical protein